MKRLIITEEEKNRIIDLHRLKEQSSPIPYQWYSPTPGDYVKVGLDKEEYRGDYIRKTENINIEDLLDDFVDIVAAVLDGIPGIGNLVSSGVDIAHSLSFFVRAYVSNDDKKKLEYIINGITTGFMAAIPIAGNVVNIGIRGTIKKFLDMTHNDVFKFLKKFGINIKNIRFDLTKNRFAYAYLAALISYLKGEIADRISSIADYIESVESKLDSLVDELESETDLPYVDEFIEAIEYIKSFFDALQDLVISIELD